MSICSVGGTNEHGSRKDTIDEGDPALAAQHRVVEFPPRGLFARGEDEYHDGGHECPGDSERTMPRLIVSRKHDGALKGQV